jgi:hypothetical protein
MLLCRCRGQIHRDQRLGSRHSLFGAHRLAGHPEQADSDVVSQMTSMLAMAGWKTSERSCLRGLSSMTSHPSELDNYAKKTEGTDGKGGSEGVTGGRDMSSIAIEQAREELRRTRDELRRASDAVLEALASKGPRPVADVMEAVAQRHGLDEATVQRAVVGLIHDSRIELTDSYELRAL